MAAYSDKWIRRMAIEHGMIEPFAEGKKREGVISYGLSAYGYDFRIGGEFRVSREPVAAPSEPVDPKSIDESLYEMIDTEICVIPPNSMVLGKTVEYFRIPRDVITICYGKSTYARAGILVNVTPFEPDWEGHATISIVNTNSRPARIYANEGIAQLLFLAGNEPCETSYKDKQGRYQAQREVTPPKI